MQNFCPLTYNTKCMYVRICRGAIKWHHHHPPGMYPGLGEWWLHKGVLNLRNLMIFNIYAQTVSEIPCGHFVLYKVV